jgi:hypothetical protein
VRHECHSLADGRGDCPACCLPGTYIASAGVRAGERDPFVDVVLEEIGLSLGRHQPQTLDELEDDYFDLIVTLAPEAHHAALELTRSMRSMWSTGRRRIRRSRPARANRSRPIARCAIIFQADQAVCLDEMAAGIGRVKPEKPIAWFTKRRLCSFRANFKRRPFRMASLNPQEENPICRKKKSSNFRASSPNCCRMRRSA